MARLLIIYRRLEAVEPLKQTLQRSGHEVRVCETSRLAEPYITSRWASLYIVGFEFSKGLSGDQIVSILPPEPRARISAFADRPRKDIFGNDVYHLLVEIDELVARINRTFPVRRVVN